MISAHGELCGARSDTTRANLLYYRPGAYMNADICFRFNKSEWKGLAQRLDEADEGAWAEAIGVFERRMRERFLSSIEALFKADTKPDTLPPYPGHTENCIPGFSIIALCCLLVDTLQGFREKPPRASAPTGPCTFPAGHCIRPAPSTTEQFKSFLRRPAFGETFKDDSVATKFVRGVRNGIFHEGETRKWAIWRDQPTGQMVAPKEDGFVLNRTLFYAAVKGEFESYLQELLKPANRILRMGFRKKMDDICEES